MRTPAEKKEVVVVVVVGLRTIDCECMVAKRLRGVYEGFKFIVLID